MDRAVRGRILDVAGSHYASRTGRVDFGDDIRRVNLSYLPDAGVGDCVLVHVGFAIAKSTPEVDFGGKSRKRA